VRSQEIHSIDQIPRLRLTDGLGGVIVDVKTCIVFPKLCVNPPNAKMMIPTSLLLSWGRPLALSIPLHPSYFYLLL